MAERLDVFDVFNAWRHMLITGQPDQLDRLEGEMGRRFLELGWSRDTAREGKLNRDPYQRNRFMCWVSGPARGPRVLLLLNRATSRRVRGGSYDLLDDPNGTGLNGMAGIVQRALTEIVEPAAAAIGLTITYPRLGPISRVGPRTTAIMTGFAESAAGQWPLPKPLEPEWRRFVAGACRDDVAFEPAELKAWFAANGWDDGASAELSRRFFADAELLAAYDEAEERPA